MLLLGEMDLALEFFQTHVFYIQTEIGAFFILAILLFALRMLKYYAKRLESLEVGVTISRDISNEVCRWQRQCRSILVSLPLIFLFNVLV